MKILYLSSLVSDSLFNKFVKKNLTAGYTGQKYHGLFVRGLVENLEDKSVTALSQPPVNKLFLQLKDHENGIKFRYVPIFPFPILKQLFFFIYSFLYTFYWCIRNLGEDKVIVCSLMRIYQFPSVNIASTLFGCKYVTVACDIPWMTTLQVSKSVSMKEKLSIWLSQKLCKSFDGYILLTETMNTVLNPTNKPSIVVEGFCDIAMQKIKNDFINKNPKNIIIYAGGLCEKYGIKNLVEAVKQIPQDDVELWLYGAGDMVDSLLEEKHTRIKYFGVCPNNEVVDAELKAMILINPRPTTDEYTRYSFPSKTLEYMVSGTYTMTTKLEGIPSEYFNYCGVIDNYDVEGLRNALTLQLNRGRKDLHSAGIRAKEFALSNKNNVSQAKKVVDFILKIK